MKNLQRWLITALTLTVVTPCTRAEEQFVINIGSKKFTESVVLGEILRHLAVNTGHRVRHRRELGGTRVLWGALLHGDIDAYPEYIGTLQREILLNENISSKNSLVAALRQRGLRMSNPLGFNNTYAIGLKRKMAEQLGLATVSDLRRYPELRFGFSNEFLDRGDGWRGLQTAYRLPQKDVRGLDHDLAYRGIESGTLDVIDLYATDAEIAYYDLFTLVDDQNYFPNYDAVVLYRADLTHSAPQFVFAIERLAGNLDEKTMRRLNTEVKLKGHSETEAASDFIRSTFSVDTRLTAQTDWQRFWHNTWEHLTLVVISLSAAIAISIPLGILSVLYPVLARWVLAIIAIIQTMPSLALFVFMIPLLGIGGPPAVAALFLYSLLPIVRNTYAGLSDIPLSLRESAKVLGLPTSARLRLIELPLATRSILAGIKTAAVINVGTATLAALIGAGGYGQPILTGIRLDDIGLILQGAVPAAVLALLVQGIFEIAERRLLPRSMRATVTLAAEPARDR